MQLSVIIPTYNRPKILKECLERLFDQHLVASDYEIIVVDDGSNVSTRNLVRKMKDLAPCELKYYYQENAGQGIARNMGLRYAKGKITLLMGDDILVTKDFLKEHLHYHRKYVHENEAVLGYVAWDPRLDISPIMKFLTNGSCVLGRYGGHQCAYEKLENRKLADFNFFYTSNISMKTALLRKFRFDTEFSKYGWEDIELGYRMQQKGNMKLYYNKKAFAYHYHQLDEDNMINRMFAIGKSAHIFHEKYPELKKVPGFFKTLILKLVTCAPVIALLALVKRMSSDRFCNYYFYALSQKHLLLGLAAGKK